jgi:hypothetical protein
MHAMIRSTDIKDRDGGVLVVASLFGMFPFLLTLSAESGYQDPKSRDGLKAPCRQVDVEIVDGCDAGKFVMPPERWIVGRMIGWLGRCRGLAKDGE